MSKCAQLGILNNFDHNVHTWKTYKGRINQYFVANDINNSTDAAGKKRKAILLSALTEGTYKLATDLALPKNVEEVPYEDFLTLLDNHFTPKRVGFGERHNFYAATQLPGETYSQWAARLRGLTEKCDFLNVEEALRDKFIMGMQPGREKEKLYAKDLADLTLAKVVEMAENLSRARAAAVASAGAGTAPASHLSVSTSQSSENQLFKISNDGKSGSVRKVKCNVCGYTNHKSSECRFANYICKKCHVKGHLRKMCTKVNYVEMDCGDKGDDDEDDDDSRNVVITIISQPEPYQASVAARLKQDIESQVMKLENRLPNLHLTHEDFPSPGAWAVLPLLGPLIAKYAGSDVRWVLFVEAHTAVRCGKLIEALGAADKQEDTMWIGYPLSDEEPTIIHHFSIYEELEEDGGFVYPNFASGFAMRMELIKTLLNQIESGQRKLEADFSIDPGYELAQLVYGDATDPGPLLTPDLSFCIISGDNCATYPKQFDTCGSAIPEESVFFAVKTWSGFHGSRARVVKKTWGRHVTNLQFYSDKDDPSLPAVDTGVPNSKTGHCMKTVAILKQVVQRVRRMPHVQWIFLADDDTILGVQRLCEILSCYRGGGDVTILGERYGYGYGKRETAAKGYDYITGGGGTALSVGAAELLSRCACADLSAPDDMTLGACARHRINVSVTHSPLFHQARPQDYARETLARDRPVSFHRHSSPEPLRVYATWFQHEDLALKRHRRDEL